MTDHAGEVNRCCLCGTYNPRCLCPACFRRYSVRRVLPAWVRALQREAKRITERDRRSRSGRNNGGRGVVFEEVPCWW